MNFKKISNLVISISFLIIIFVSCVGVFKFMLFDKLNIQKYFIEDEVVEEVVVDTVNVDASMLEPTIKGDNLIEITLDIIDSVTSMADYIFFRENFIELNSFVQLTQGATVIADSDENIIKLNDEYIELVRNLDLDIEEFSENLIDLSSYLEERDIDLIYIQTPWKVSEYEDNIPADTKEVYDENTNEVVNELIANIEDVIDVVDLREELNEQNLSVYDVMFKTDHHWNIQGAFWGWQTLAETLNESYEFDIEEQYTDLESFNIEVYEDLFLGSQGIRVGQNVVGLDDFSLITPNFDTSFDINVPQYSVEETGDFESVLLQLENLEVEDYYEDNAYETYLYDLVPEINIENNNITGKKVLLVRDSFGNALAPFLALGCESLDVLDLRLYKEKTLVEYIDETEPDIVIFLYNGAFMEQSEFEFGSVDD